MGRVGMQGQGREQALPFAIDAQADIVQRAGLFPAFRRWQPFGQRPPAAPQAVPEDEQQQGQGGQAEGGEAKSRRRRRRRGGQGGNQGGQSTASAE